MFGLKGATEKRVSSQIHYIWHNPNAKPRFFQLLHSLQQLYRTDMQQETLNYLLAPQRAAARLSARAGGVPLKFLKRFFSAPPPLTPASQTL